MFTGIIEERGEITQINHQQHRSYLTFRASKVLEDVKLGDSIAVNGVCLTVTQFDNHSFQADLMPETIKRTGFHRYQRGTKVNLERALRVGDRLGGHMVSGHIDGEAKLSRIDDLGDIHELTFVLQNAHEGLLIPKGSIAIDGISLTLISVAEREFKVGIIPHTFAETNLAELKIGGYVNIEFDLVGKYIKAQHQAERSQLNYQTLSHWGY
ncbi:riboflavin synthase [Ignatzschineria ureiclastica]|uniref:Riboflavin synthase n=1 Tax=Ignatzschineria ureiclastica TaxID=472582 RepID=A0A2U2AE22_9GAMM|nr:riboflavin synthase [Ignatzschineria ureiclastica]PWD80867.1 riboflavin synthase [Ignatzschineria ureiclastica]GGZ94255.1 riboflavin synthase [Ignatzschineria ureiclastica]